RPRQTRDEKELSQNFTAASTSPPMAITVATLVAISRASIRAISTRNASMSLRRATSLQPVGGSRSIIVSAGPAPRWRRSATKRSCRSRSDAIIAPVSVGPSSGEAHVARIPVTHDNNGAYAGVSGLERMAGTRSSVLAGGDAVAGVNLRRDRRRCLLCRLPYEGLFFLSIRNWRRCRVEALLLLSVRTLHACD